MKSVLSVFFVGLVLLSVGCDTRSSLPSPVNRDQVTQVSIINALMLGQYDGVMTVRELLEHGDFGLGTCDHLDGELIVLDGKAYQAKSDGSVASFGPESTTPFAVVTSFEKDGEASCGPVGSLTDLESRLDTLIPNQDVFMAVRLDADCESITIRSVPRQEPPYLPLAEVAKKQATWTRPSVKGTLVGFRSPKWAAGLNVPGYHWHFLSSDHQIGGHVFDCQLRSGSIAYDECDAWLIKLNDKFGPAGKDLSENLSDELEQVERQRGNPRTEDKR